MIVTPKFAKRLMRAASLFSIAGGLLFVPMADGYGALLCAICVGIGITCWRDLSTRTLSGE